MAEGETRAEYYARYGLTPGFRSVNSLSERRKPFNPPTDFEGQVERGAVTSAKFRTLTADIISGGTIDVAIGIGHGNVKIDGANRRIIINDGTNDRVLIGYQEDGF